MKRKLLSIIFIFIFVVSLGGCKCNHNNEEEVKRGTIIAPLVIGYEDKDKEKSVSNYPFNTSISVDYYYESEGNLIKDYFIEEFTRLHKLFDRHYYYFDDDTLINNLRVLNESKDQDVVVDQDLINIFKEGIRFTKLSKGKFNIAIGDLSSLWDSFIEVAPYLGYFNLEQFERYDYVDGVYSANENGNYLRILDAYIDISDNSVRYNQNREIDSNGSYILIEEIAPSELQIQEALNCTPSYQQIDDIIVINEENKTIRINSLAGCNGNVTITLGALAKSYATEKIASDERFKDGNYLINAGQSTIKLIGKNPTRDGGTWNVGITDSYLVYRDKGFVRYASFMMQTGAGSISTSSGDEKHYYYKDKYYHHIIDPSSGYPNQNRFAVTAVSENAMIADIVTTSLMSMNMEESKEYLNALANEGIHMEVFIQDKVENFIKVFVTSGLKDKITLRDSDEYHDYLNSIVIEEFSYDTEEE